MSFYRVSVTKTFKALLISRIIVVCNPSDTVIGGGYSISNLSNLAFSSWPFNETYWEILGYNPESYDIDVTGYAICAHITP
jgi:hypothetical protein